MRRCLVAVEIPEPEPEPRKCGHLGCPEVGTVTTTLYGHRRTWELVHCEEHEDGPALAMQLGFRLVSAGSQVVGTLAPSRQVDVPYNRSA